MWSPLVTSPSIPNPTATPSATTITVTVTDSLGQTASASVTVLVGGGLLPPVLTGISPATGLTTGGTFVTISGDNFLAGATVQFGSQAQAISVEERDNRTLTAVTPPGSGTVDVTVTNPDNQAATLPGAFTYYPPLVITAVTPTPPAVIPIATSQLFVTPAGGVPPYAFQWTSDPALSSLTSAAPVASPSNPPVCCGSVARTSVYHVTVTDSLSNSVAGSVTLTIIGPVLQAGRRPDPAWRYDLSRSSRDV